MAPEARYLLDRSSVQSAFAFVVRRRIFGKSSAVGGWGVLPGLKFRLDLLGGRAGEELVVAIGEEGVEAVAVVGYGFVYQDGLWIPQDGLGVAAVDVREVAARGEVVGDLLQTVAWRPRVVAGWADEDFGSDVLRDDQLLERRR